MDPISEVSGIKRRLANLGFYSGPMDGDMDEETQEALARFQTQQGLPATGQADEATRQKLLDRHLC